MNKEKVDKAIDEINDKAKEVLASLPENINIDDYTAIVSRDVDNFLLNNYPEIYLRKITIRKNEDANCAYYTFNIRIGYIGKGESVIDIEKLLKIK